MNFLHVNFILALWVTAITTLLLGIFVLARNRSSIINKTFFFYSSSISLWSFSEIWGIACDSRTTALIWTRIEQVGVFFIPVLFLHFVISLLEIKDKKWLIKVSYLISSIFAVLSSTSLMIADSVLKPTIPYVKRFAIPGLMYHFAILYFVVVVAYGLIILYKAYKLSTGAKQARLRYLLWSSIFGYLGGSANFLLVYGVDVPFMNPFGTYALPLYIAVVAYAIVRHQLMDIEVVIKKTLVFAGIFTVAYGVIVGITFLGQAVFEEFTGGNRWIALIPSIALIILILRPLENFLTKVTDKFLFQKKYDYRQLIGQFMDELKTMVLNAGDIAQSTLDFLNSSIRPDNSIIFMHNNFTNRYDIIASVDFHDVTFKIKDDALFIEKLQEAGEIVNLKRDKAFSERELKELEAMGIYLIIPLIVHKELLGILGLGKKKSDEEYTEEDIEALSNLSGTLSIAINNAQLFDERADAEKRAMIGTLATGINHEIGNPLNVIAIKLQSFNLLGEQGLLEKKSKQEIIDEVKNITKVCMENTKRISDITRKVSEFAKPDKKLQLDKINVEEAIDETLSVLQHELTLERIKFEKNIMPEPHYVIADRGQFKQMLFNLIRNAAQAIENTNKEDGKITIGDSKHGDEEIYLKVEDNGPGIPKKDLNKIFMPFYTTKEPGKGTGLGLALVNKLVQRNDAKIEVTSQVGKGTVFTLIFKGKSYE
ncbi:MAG: ATP-binding protein [Omnitrophica bacterium]|nr:ATP-binding protein [Candidatus Omnitrophota bacterium]